MINDYSSWKEENDIVHSSDEIVQMFSIFLFLLEDQEFSNTYDLLKKDNENLFKVEWNWMSHKISNNTKIKVGILEDGKIIDEKSTYLYVNKISKIDIGTSLKKKIMESFIIYEDLLKFLNYEESDNIKTIYWFPINKYLEDFCIELLNGKKIFFSIRKNESKTISLKTKYLSVDKLDNLVYKWMNLHKSENIFKLRKRSWKEFKNERTFKLVKLKNGKISNSLSEIMNDYFNQMSSEKQKIWISNENRFFEDYLNLFLQKEQKRIENMIFSKYQVNKCCRIFSINNMSIIKKSDLSNIDVYYSFNPNSVDIFIGEIKSATITVGWDEFICNNIKLKIKIY